MLVDGSFLENEVTAKNLVTLTSVQALETEKRICEIRELADDAARAAYSLYKEGYGIYEILSIINEGIEFTEEIGMYHPMEENTSAVFAYVRTLAAEDKAAFSQFFAEKLRLHEIPMSESDFLREDKNGETFIYVKNLLADEAYDVFSQEFFDPRVSYCQTFRDAVDSVLSGVTEYCILPLEERGGSRITGISQMLFSEELKISAVTPVFGMDGAADMKYALVSRHFNVPEFDPEDDRYLEIRFMADSTALLRDLLITADAHGVDVYRVNTVVFNTDDGPIPYFSVVFRKSKTDFSEFLVYLTLFCSSYTAVGIYNNLE